MTTHDADPGVSDVTPVPGEETESQPETRDSSPSTLRRLAAVRHVSLIYVGLLIVAIFAVWTPSNFLTGLTAQEILQQQVVTGIAAVGLIVPLAAGVFDLSVGYGVGLSAIVSADLIGNHGASFGEATAIALAVGLLLGAFNGLLVVGIGIDSFIATLASGSLAAAVILMVSNNTEVIFDNHTLTAIGTQKAAGIPIPVFIFFVVAVLLWFGLRFTPIGRRVYAVGGGREAARLAGVRVGWLIFGSLMVSGLCAAIAGVVLTANVGAGSPDLGPQYLLPAFAAAFLGSTQVKTGRFNVWGTVLAVYVLGIGIEGLQLVTGAAWVPYLFNGVVLVIAVGFAVVGRRHEVLLRRIRARAFRRGTQRA